MFTLLLTLISTYLVLSYLVGIALFAYEYPRNPKELIPFGIILLFLSPFTAPSGVNFYYKAYKAAQKKAVDPTE